MKYEGKKISGKDATVYTFTVGREELEILKGLVHLSYKNTPKVFENIPYKGRLRNLDKVFAEMWIEEVENRTAPTKHRHKLHN